MTRYFFDVHDSKDLPDDIGTEFPNREAMRNAAVTFAGEVLREADGSLVGKLWSMTVRDEGGGTLMTLRFSAEEH